MLRMDQVHVIRHKVLIEGQSIRRVAREMGLSRLTVKKYLESSEPVRQRYRSRARPVWDQVRARLEELVAQWEPRTTAKQRLTGVRLHRALREEGHQVGLTMIHEYLRERRRQRAEVFVPLIHRAGDEAQIDFFEVTVEISGEWVKAWKFLLRLMYSGREFVWLYQRCDKPAFLDGHVRAFANLGGVPRRCVYDNLPAAVRKIVGAERQLTKRFAALVSHYLFEPCFARVGEGHDKGGVESRGKAIRLQHLVPVPRGEDLEQISQALLADLEESFARRRNAEGRPLTELWSEERARLLGLSATSFDISEPIPVEISSRALVRVEGGWYSVPSRWARLRATAYVGVDQVRLVCMDESVTHPRVGFGRRRVVYRHYLPELARKPQAVRQVAPELLAELGEPWGKLWQLLADTHGERDAARVMAKLLGAVEEHGEERVRPVLEAALAGKRLGLLDVIVRTPEVSAPITVPKALADFVIEAAKAADYDHLLLTDGGSHE
jgi:transposase